MKKKPVLVIMAAGMGSRYGGLKQIDPVDAHGNLIIDFSIYDAIEAGFEKVIFIIKKAIESDFKELIGDRMSRHIQTVYVFQELDQLPKGFQKPQGREKPWGTAHAILCCEPVLDAPFAVINADDYYGKSAFQSMYAQLSSMEDDEVYRYAMVGYDLYKTLTDHGHVARGICTVDSDGLLAGIHERTRIESRDGQAAYTEDGGAAWVPLSRGTVVSMNLWGFTPSIFRELDSRFSAFLEDNLPINPLKCEYFLPSVVDSLLKEHKAQVQVLTSQDNWYGVTYREDKEQVMKAIKAMKEQGLYPETLWEDR